MSEISANPAKVSFPRDQWGFTTALRKYGLLVAGAIRGDEQKLKLYIQTLGILAQHAQARIASDRAAKEERLAKIASRAQAEPIIAAPEPVTEPTD